MRDDQVQRKAGHTPQKTSDGEHEFINASADFYVEDALEKHDRALKE